MLKDIRNMLFPQWIKCIVCGGELDSDAPYGLCGKCVLEENKAFCLRCGRSVAGDLPQHTQPAARYICEECDSVYKPPYAAARAPFLYEGNVKKLMYGLKYGGKKYLGAYMARFMADSLRDLGAKADFITFVPMHPKRLKRRGYNQAEVLAAELGKLTGIKCLSVLEKTANTKNAAKLTRAARYEILSNSIAFTEGLTLSGQSVLLVDDVLTSGATSGECARHIINAGAGMVCVVTFATSRILV